MYNIFSNLVRDAFSNDPRFLTVRDQAFQEVVNNTDIFRLELNVFKNKRYFFIFCSSKRLILLKFFIFSQKTVSAESKCPELLANYCDLLLRKSALTKRFTSEEVDEKLNNVVSLLILKLVIKSVFNILAASFKIRIK